MAAKRSFQEIKKSISSNITPSDSANPFAKEISEASELFKLLCNESWVDPKQFGIVRVSKFHPEGLTLPFLRTEGIIKGKWSPEEVLSVLTSKFARLKFNERLMELKILKYLDLHSTITYTTQRGTWPVGPRDVLVVNSISESSPGVWDIIATSIDDKHGPPLGENGMTRVHVLISSFRIEKVTDGVSISQITQIDPKGTIPKGILLFDNM
jgi:hypothetical protein